MIIEFILFFIKVFLILLVLDIVLFGLIFLFRHMANKKTIKDDQEKKDDV